MYDQVELQGVTLLFVFATEGQDLPHEVLSASAGGEHLLQVVPGDAALGYLIECQLTKAENHAENVVKIMRDSPGKNKRAGNIQKRQFVKQILMNLIFLMGNGTVPIIIILFGLKVKRVLQQDPIQENTIQVIRCSRLMILMGNITMAYKYTPMENGIT
jgi:hypothetical protein